MVAEKVRLSQQVAIEATYVLSVGYGSSNGPPLFVPPKNVPAPPIVPKRTTKVYSMGTWVGLYAEKMLP